MCLDIFLSVLAHVNLKLLAAHMYGFGTEVWSAHRLSGLRNALVNLPRNLSVTTREVHSHPWSLFISMYVAHIAMVPQCLRLTIRAPQQRL